MDPQLQGAQLTVGDDQEVSAAAGRVEKCDRAEVFEQLLEVALLRACLDEPFLELVEEQGADELQDVGLGCVVLAQSAPGLLRSEEHTSELQSRGHLVCRLLLEKKNHIK